MDLKSALENGGVSGRVTRVAAYLCFGLACGLLMSSLFGPTSVSSGRMSTTGAYSTK